MKTSSPARLVLAPLVAAFLAAGSSATAQCLREQDRGAADWEEFGFSCANTGDVDHDGIDDFIVGARGYDSGHYTANGRVVVYSGATGAKIRQHSGSESNEQLGFSVAGAGDVDGDGISDYVVGAIGHSTRRNSNLGRAIVYSGATGSVVWMLDGTTAGEYLGYAVARVGDLDGDGRSDVIVGSQSDDVFVLDADGNTIWHLVGADKFGSSVAGCDDVDGDLVTDFLVGAPYADLAAPPLTDAGSIDVISGATGLSIWQKFGTRDADRLGLKLATIDDIDNDGFRDFIGGAPASWANGNFTGMAVVVSGFTGATIREHDGALPGTLLGTCISRMGDVDGDGVPDYLLGGEGAYWGVGALTLHSGADGHAIHEWSGDASMNSSFGKSVAAGDWNGDGIDDVIVGASKYFVAPDTLGALDVYLTCPAWWSNYGAGWPGNNGVPALTASQNPEVGSPIDVDLGNSLGATTTALLLIGFDPTSVPMNGSGTLLVVPRLVLTLPLPATGLTLSETLPDDPALCFFDVYLQAVEFDAFASKKLSFTPGLQLHCGYDLQ